MQNSLQVTEGGRRPVPMIGLFMTVFGLILIDQLTKIIANSGMPPARLMLSQPGWNFGLALHIHEPNAYSHVQALLTFAVVGFAWTLPIPAFSKVMWAAAGISNHVEMLARPGTVDFLAMRVGDTMWVANVADIYCALGTVTLLFWLTQRVRAAKSWLEPVTA